MGAGAPLTVARALLSPYLPWVRFLEGGGVCGQATFHRSTATTQVCVCGRQSGKTHGAAEKVVRTILTRPRTESCLLMPTYKSTKGALRHIRRALEPLGSLVLWKEVDKCFCFPNGSVLWVRTADDKSGVPTRGLTIDGVLWVDEASFVPRSAWEAALNTQMAVQNPVRLITTTARGRKGSWVFDLARQSLDDPGIEFFRFRTTDSPFHNPADVERARRILGRVKAQEELDAVFIEDSEAPFSAEDIERAFSEARIQPRGKQQSIGMDLGKERTWTVLTMLNEFGEARVLARFQPKKSWQQAVDRAVEAAERHKAIVVVDTAHGGGAGQVVHDLIRDILGESRVLGVNTGIAGTKGQLIERLKLDFEHGRILIDPRNADELRHELTYFPAPERKTVGVKEILVYRPPDDDEDRFDDTVISLALAKYGQENGWDSFDPLEGDFSGFGEDPSGTKPPEFGFGGSIDLYG